MASRRRSAEHTVRYASLIQMFINALHVLNIMDEKVVKCGGISEEFEVEAKNKVRGYFHGTCDKKTQRSPNRLKLSELMY